MYMQTFTPAVYGNFCMIPCGQVMPFIPKTSDYEIALPIGSMLLLAHVRMAPYTSKKWAVLPWGKNGGIGMRKVLGTG